MKAAEVLSEINRYAPTFSRSTLGRYVDKGYIKAKKLPSGRYNYDSASVNKLLKLLEDGQSFKENKIAFYSNSKTMEFAIEWNFNLPEDSRKENSLYYYDNNKTLALKRKSGLKKLLIKILEGKVQTVIVPNKNVFGSKKTKEIVNNICEAMKVRIVVKGSQNE